MKLIIFDLDDTLYDRIGQLDETYANLKDIKPFPDAIKVLKLITPPKILLSFGDPVIQEQKIDALGVRNFFKEIHICSDSPKEKKEIIRYLMKKYKVTPAETLIVGDRIDSELRFGKLLGCITVRLLHGKYKDLKPKDEYEIPTYTIKRLGEVIKLCKQ